MALQSLIARNNYVAFEECNAIKTHHPLAIQKIDIFEFLNLAKSNPVFDVRSPSEFDHAHIPDAISLPLFSDAERTVVGTAYKQESREKAIKIGLDYFGPKMRWFVEEVESILSNHQNGNEKIVLIHCWRGGMRSGAVAWLLDLYGFNVYLLSGGYKRFRNWVLDQFTKDYNVKILGGYTGSGKTEILHFLDTNGTKVLDLEGIANHKGSAFGNIGMPEQSSQEMFENKLAVHLYHLAVQGADQTLWMEDESQRIGKVMIHPSLWKSMQKADIYFLEIPFEQRLDFIIQVYGSLDKEKLIAGILRIQKRLGGLEANNAIKLLEDGNVKESFNILLKYYDKFYLKGLEKKNTAEKHITYIKCNQVDARENAPKLFL